MKLTEEIFNHLAPTGSFTQAQMKVFGEKWPPVKGWKKRIIDAEITQDHFLSLLTFRKQLEERKSAEFGVRGRTRKSHKKESAVILASLPPVILPQIKTEDWTRKTWMKEERKTYIDVSYAEKDDAKSLGAKWDIKLKKWYVIGDTSAFYKWL